MTSILYTTALLLIVLNKQYTVIGNSLRPILLPGTTIEMCPVEECQVRKGSIVFFTSPTAKDYLVVKKLVATPNDWLEVNEEGYLTINGDVVNGLDGNPYYIPENRRKFVELYSGPLKENWVIGARGSNDSLILGAIPTASIYGTADPPIYYPK